MSHKTRVFQFGVRTGFSSIEVILASTLFIIFTTGIIGTVIQGVSTNRLGNEHVVATQFASEGLDAVRSIKERGFSNITTVNTLPRGVSFTAGNWVFDADNTSDTQTHTTTDNFIRQIRVEPVNRDGSGNIVASGGSVDPLTRKVTATVTWNFSSSRPQTVSAVSYLSDWVATVPPTPTGTIIPSATPTTVPATGTIVPPTPTRTPTPVAPTPTPPTWAYRKQITIQDARVAGTTNHTNFPVLINFSSDADLAARAQDDGDDIKFTSSDGVTKLDHEIETFNGTTGQLVAWVQVPTLNATANTTIYMYYGNATATNQQNVTGTWDSNYMGVWHLKETSGAHRDSTVNNLSSSTVNVSQQGVNIGKMNGADVFDGVDDYVSIPRNSVFEPANGITVAAWLNWRNHTTSSHGNIVSKSKDTDTDPYVSYSLKQTSSTSQEIEFTLTINGIRYFLANNSGTVPLNTWNYFVGTWSSGNTVKLYMNGSLVGQSASAPSGTITYYNTPLRIGWSASEVVNQQIDGTIDEVRISNIARSANWITTQYNNQNSPSTFYTIGAQQTL
jgi:Tfp pilus assembly protein PilV